MLALTQYLQANWNDTLNGLFELGGAFVLLLNVRAILRDKVVRGFHPAPTVFFTSWGLWNLLYYPSLDQWFSFAGGAAIVLVNTIFLVLIWYYQNNREIGQLATEIKRREERERLSRLSEYDEEDYMQRNF